MKKLLQKIVLVTAALFGLTASQQLLAAHQMGAEITYTQTAPFTYDVYLRMYRECASQIVNSVTVQVSSPNCNTGRSVQLALVPTLTQVINQTCQQASGNPCNVVKDIYKGTVTLSISERTCQNWVFSWSECCRPAVRNLLNATGASMYAEATVRVNQSLTNSTPAFSPLENGVSLLGFSTEVVYGLAGNDPDCDSLSFELVQPLTSANTVIAYAPLPQSGSSGQFLINPCPLPPYGPFNPQTAMITGTTPQMFSATFPIPALSAINWTGPPTVPYPQAPGGHVWEAKRGVSLDPVTGQLSFVPALFIPNGSSISGDNRYAIEVKISEWRKANGPAFLVGTTRRSMVFTVADAGGNGNPTLTNITVNGNPISSGEIITLRPGMPLNLQFKASDCNAGPYTFSSDVEAALPGAIFSPGTGATPAGNITWVASQICNGIKFFQIKVEDDACPLKGFQTHTFGMRVSATAAVTGLPEQQTVAGSFTVYPNPFSSQVSFRFSGLGKGAQQVQIYNSVGQLVDQFELKAGGQQQEVSWEKASAQGSGLYIARLVQNGKPVQTIRFTKAN